jgi:phenylacetate-CoA ligase
VAEKINLHGANIRVIIVAGEPGGSVPAIRQRIEQLWPTARVFDHHGMTEVGPVTYEHAPGTLAVIESAYIAQIIHPAQDGTGELVLTNLGRVGSPLIRYRTGDLVKPVALPTGMGFEGGIIGRADDMVVIRGVNLYPSAVEKVLAGFPDVAEYRVEVRRTAALAQVSLTVEPIAACANADTLAQRVENALRDTFMLRIPVRTVGPDALPRFEMKARRWVVLDDRPSP